MQVCIDRVVRDDTGAGLALLGERVVELVRNKKRVLTRVVFLSTAVSGLHLSWYAAALLRIL